MNDQQSPSGPLVKLITGKTTSAASLGVTADRNGIRTFSNCNRANRTQPFTNPGRVIKEKMQQNKFSNPLWIHLQRLKGTISGDFHSLMKKPRPEALHVWEVTNINLFLKNFFLYFANKDIFSACLLNKQQTYSIFSSNSKLPLGPYIFFSAHILELISPLDCSNLHNAVLTTVSTLTSKPKAPSVTSER